MYTLSFSHSRSIRFFCDTLREGSVVEEHQQSENIDRLSNEDLFRGEFIHLLENEDFRQRLEAAIRSTPDLSKRGDLMNSLLGFEATRKKIESIHAQTRGDLQALMAEIAPAQETIDA